MKEKYVIGVDFGTDSVRAVLVNTKDGNCKEQSVHSYQRWSERKFCNASKNQFRQHPLDYIEGIESTIKSVVSKGAVAPDEVLGICIDTTGSTPVAVDSSGTPLALTPGFEENPNAMFILWKDHTAIKEAAEINAKVKEPGSIDYTRYVGGIYSSEWFWAKILHIHRIDKQVAEAAHSWMEHCDWMTYHLIGGRELESFKRSRCAAGHKAMWHPEWGGLPPENFLASFDPDLSGLRDNLYDQCYTSDEVAGYLSEEWAQRLGLHTHVAVSVGTFDAHAGAVGGEVSDHVLVKVMGTSTCDITIATQQQLGSTSVEGICGQVEGSVIPGKIGLEAGQSAFGDLLAWYRDMLAWPIKNGSQLSAEQQKEIIDGIIPKLSEQASKIPLEDSHELALDWVNGRRTPDANQELKGALRNLNMGSDAPRVFKALVEAICFGSKAIVERFNEQGVPIKGIIGLGGVAKKSPFVMQTLANVLDMPIKIARSEQAPALGAAMYAAVASGIYPDVSSAISAMGNGFDASYTPENRAVAYYKKKYQAYKHFGQYIEQDALEELIFQL